MDIKNMSEVFSDIYLHNKWVKGSGFGSTKECTKDYIKFLYKFMNKYNITSVVDYGCGDWQMLSNYKFEKSQKYYGFDVVKSVIENNRHKYENENIKFFQLNDINDINIHADLIMVKDVLQHWNDNNIIFFLKNVINRFKYALLTNYFSNETNKEIKIGSFRSINLELPPYNLLSFEWKIDMYFCKELKRIYFHTS